ncbi:sodium:solute symporter family transporter [Negadavirga shengliensis]|uniref:Sodium/solute symporter n=1 Tax=Negadavirga shengliensis TaxID=1389218 RepID=A0ABV9SX31_9BACT
MHRISSLIFLGFFLLASLNVRASGPIDPFPYGEYQWETIAELPVPQGLIYSPGYAGMYAGTHNGVLILAGGANFPDALPWQGGKKRFWDHIYVLKKGKEGYEWDSTVMRLPKPVAYGSTVSTPQGILCLGGENETGHLQDVWWFIWDAETQSLQIKDGKPLPLPLANASAVLLDDYVYLAGGENQSVSNGFYRLSLKKENADWESLPSWTGEARSHAALTVQSDGQGRQIYLAGGRSKQPNTPTQWHGDIHVFYPKTSVWKHLGKMEDGEGNPAELAAGTSAGLGSGHILFFGGDDGELFHRLEALAQKISASDIHREDSLRWVQERDIILENHPGFSKRVLAYHPVTGSWSRLPDLPFGSQVTTPLVQWGDALVVPSGEVSPGRRTPEIRRLEISKKEEFGGLNYTILGIYLGSLVLMGVIISKKQLSTSDFFRAGGRVPWWAAGISVFGTQLSAITFMAIPAKTFATDWTLFWLLMTIIMVSPIIIFWFLPFFRRLNLTSAYEYLEFRFNKTVRLMGSFIYIALQLGRLGIVLLLPSLALSVVTGMDVVLCILLMGILSILYTVLGGIEAVIWTDVIQVVVLLGGALICLILMVMKINMDGQAWWAFIKEDSKTLLFDTSLDFTGTAIWVILLGGIASNIAQYGSDQTVIQRYLTTKDEKTAAKGILTGALMALPSALVFFSLGTALYLFYRLHPQELSPVMANTDSIFPWYIVTQLPNGISGLLIAAVFAAAMSSLDSSMNSVATVVTTDFYKKIFPKDLPGKHSLKFARFVTILVGAVGTAFAILMASMGIPSLWDQFNMLIGLFAGGLGGIFLIGILSSSSNGPGAVIGLTCSAMVQLLVKYQTDLSIHLYAFTGLASAMLFTYLASRFFQRPSRKELQGLTLKTMGNREKALV